MSVSGQAYVEDEDTPGASRDTPITRASVIGMQVDELDAMIANIRDRRLRRVAQLNQLSRANTERATIDARAKFERMLARARALMVKLEVSEQACVEAINKCRGAALDLE
jgi:predicted DNA-binding protein (UPF0251 family)